MAEWWTYRPSDFLLFSPRVYWRMFELHNAAVWPLHLAMLAVGLAFVLIALRRHALPDRWAALGLAALWAFVGWSFLWGRYAAINWAIAYVAPAFGIQALLLAVLGARGIIFGRRDMAGQVGLLLAMAGLVGYPLVAWLFGRSWSSAEVFGIAPDPTAITTLGILLGASSRLVPLLFPIPVLWLLFSGLTLRTMDDAQAWIPFSAAGTAVVVVVLRSVTRRNKVVGLWVAGHD